jgi:hypothetical protein
MGDEVSDIDKYRMRSRECLQLAAAVSDERAKAFWLRSAEDWMNVAAASKKLVDRRGDCDPKAA